MAVVFNRVGFLLKLSLKTILKEFLIMKIETPYLATDCVIKIDDGIVVIKRGNAPYEGQYALPGGFVEIGESVEEACRREMKEETGLAFASTHDGVMHACGHDAHMAMALGAATVLTRIKNDLNGTIKFVFQPAEEGPGGAKPMIDAGVMDNPKVDYSIGCHVWPEIAEGTGIRTSNAGNQRKHYVSTAESIEPRVK